jgi:hypothetical protein
MMLARILIVLALLIGPAWGQYPQPAPGIPVDSHGNQTIDPTKNVLDLVIAAVKRIDDLAAEVTKRYIEIRDADTRFQNAARDAETRRIDQLAAQKLTFDLELARVIRANQDSSTLLLASQLKELKTDLGLKIDQNARDMSERVTKLEQYANETRGRSSAADPALAALLQDVKTLVQSRADLSGKSVGQNEMFGWVVLAIGVLIALVGLFANVFRRRVHV